jgi:heat shock protein HslJ
MTRSPLFRAASGGLLFTALVAPQLLATFGCSSDSASVGSTDTGNPPVIDTQSLSVERSGDGVVVSAEPGGVPGGASVEVTNLETGDSASTTADDDGAFEVELAGSVDDEYEVEVEIDGERDSATVTAGGSGPNDNPLGALEGKELVLESSEGYDVVSGTTVTLRFEEGEFSFNAGCNSFSNEYTYCDGNLCAGDSFTGTLIGCPEDLGNQDAWFTAFFSSEPSVTIDGDRVTFTNSEATLVFVDSEAVDPLAALVGRDFELESSEGFTPVTDTTVRIGIREEEFSFDAGCNGHSGEYSFCDGALCVDGFSSTEIGCDEPRHAQDEWLADFFTSTPMVTPNGDRVTFANDDASLVFLDTEVADPDRPLTGSVWTVDTFIMGDAATNVPTPEPPTLEFHEDGTVTMFTACVESVGEYTVDGNVITLGDMPIDEIGCPEETQAAHDGMLRVMTPAGELSYEIDAGRLWLTRGDVGLGATTE